MTPLLAFSLILATSCAGLLGAPWPILLASALALTMVSLFEHRRLQARFSAVGLADVFQTFAISNAGVSFIATICAYGMGLLVRAVMLGS